MFSIITGGALAPAVLTTIGCQWEAMHEPDIFDPTQNRHTCTLTDRSKIVKGGYVHDFYSCAKFGGNPSMGASGQIDEILTIFRFYLYPFFKQHTYRSDRSPHFHA